MDANGVLVQTGQMETQSKQERRTTAPAWKKAASPKPAISVIIPAHNEQDYLGPTLDALWRQEFPAAEIVVVANGCADRTVEVARGRCHRLITLSEKSLGVARNLGARMARGDLLVFVDADTILEPAALRRIKEMFSEQHAAGTLKGKPDCGRLAYRMIYFLKNFEHRSGLHGGSSGVIICWRKHFLEAGGFNEALEIGENSDLIRRLKRFGRYQYIGAATATTSMRRYERRGFRKIAWLWIKLWFHSLFGGDLRHRKYEIVR